MERLSREIQYDIFDRLEINEKLKCLLVSKSWNNILHQTCLFSRINTIKNEANLTRAIRYFDSHKDLGHQVLSINISSDANMEFYLHRLVTLFPNVKKAVLDNLDNLDLDYEIVETPNATNRWMNLQDLSIYEKEDPPIMMVEFILSTVHYRLTSFCYRNHFYARQMDTRLVHCLRNAPNLTRIELDTICMSLIDLEALHEHLPHLKSLIFLDASFILTEYEEDELNIPAPTRQLINYPKPVSLDVLHIAFTNMGDETNEEFFLGEITLTNLLLYMTNKYSNLKEFSIVPTSPISLYNKFNTHTFQQHAISLLSRCPHLSKYEMPFCPITDDILNEMKNNNIKLNQVVLFANIENMNAQCQALSRSSQKMSPVKVILPDEPHQLRARDDYIPFDVQAYDMSRPEVCIIDSLMCLEYLADLTIQVPLPGKTNILVLYRLLNELHTLKSIQLQNLFISNTFGYGPDLDIFEARKIKHIKLESIEIDQVIELSGLTSFLKAILPACPQLETFSLSTTITPYSSFNSKLDADSLRTIELDFQLNINLQSLEFNMTEKPVTNYYFLRYNQPTVGGFHVLDPVRKTFRMVRPLKPQVFFITLILSTSVLVNHVRI